MYPSKKCIWCNVSFFRNQVSLHLHSTYYINCNRKILKCNCAMCKGKTCFNKTSRICTTLKLTHICDDQLLFFLKTFRIFKTNLFQTLCMIGLWGCKLTTFEISWGWRINSINLSYKCKKVNRWNEKWLFSRVRRSELC